MLNFHALKVLWDLGTFQHWSWFLRMDFSRESILQQHLPLRAKHTLQSMGSSWQAVSALSRSQLYCCLLPHPRGIPVGTGSHTADERKGRRCNWDKIKDLVCFLFVVFFFFNRSSLLKIYIIKSNSFQINWVQYLGMWLVYRPTKHSVSLGTKGLVLETKWCQAQLFSATSFGYQNVALWTLACFIRATLLAHWWARSRL